MSDKIGNKIKELRLKLGLTQEELGEIVGVKKAAINKYESGLVRNIKRDMQERLARALRTDPVSLFYPDASSSEPTLSEDEKLLIQYFRQMNDEGKQELLEHADTNVRSGKYIKTRSDTMVDPNASEVNK